MPNISKKQRIGIILSGAWLLVVLLVCKAGLERVDAIYLIYGVLPVMVGWGVWWILKGRATTNNK